MPHTVVVICRQASVNGHYSLSYMSRITCLILWSLSVDRPVLMDIILSHI